jgi:hypothetical protein
MDSHGREPHPEIGRSVRLPWERRCALPAVAQVETLQTSVSAGFPRGNGRADIRRYGYASFCPC